MKLYIIFLATLFAIVSFAAGCDDDAGDDSTTNDDSAAQGSCILTDPDGIEYCYEVEETDPTFKHFCEFLDDQRWSFSACDESLYDRKCVQETDVTSDQGKTWEIHHYVYYVPNESTMTCMGDESAI